MTIALQLQLVEADMGGDPAAAGLFVWIG